MSQLIRLQTPIPPPPASITQINGDVGSTVGPIVTFTGGTSGAVFTIVGATVTESFNYLSLPTTAAGGNGIVYINSNRFMSAFGTDNTFLGTNSGNLTLTTASNNTGIGFLALSGLTTGTFNVAVGDAAMFLSSSATQNVAVGSNALLSCTTGQNNVAVGFNALANSVAAGSNVGIGMAALTALTTGSQNTGIGVNTLDALTTGHDNIALGFGAGSANTLADSNNIYVGNAGVLGESGTIRLGTTGIGAGQQSNCYVAGIQTVDVGSVASVVSINGDHLGETTITAGSGITVTPGANSITLSSSNTLAYTPLTVADSPYDVLVTDYFLDVDTSGGQVIVRLPNTTTTGRVFIVKDAGGTAATNNIRVRTVSGLVPIDGALAFVMNTDYEAAQFLFTGTDYRVF